MSLPKFHKFIVNIVQLFWHFLELKIFFKNIPSQNFMLIESNMLAPLTSYGISAISRLWVIHNGLTPENRIKFHVNISTILILKINVLLRNNVDLKFRVFRMPTYQVHILKIITPLVPLSVVIFLKIHYVQRFLK